MRVRFARRWAAYFSFKTKRERVCVRERVSVCVCVREREKLCVSLLMRVRERVRPSESDWGNPFACLVTSQQLCKSCLVIPIVEAYALKQQMLHQWCQTNIYPCKHKTEIYEFVQFCFRISWFLQVLWYNISATWIL